MFLAIDARFLIGLTGAAAALGVTYNTVKRFVERGQIPSTKTSDGHILIDVRDVLVLYESRKGKKSKRAGRRSIKEMIAASVASAG